MIQILIILATIISGFSKEILFENKFLLDNEGWQITGNKRIEKVVHQTYNINNEISHYIMFKDNLIVVDHKSMNDKTLWYFESPEITINPVQKIGTFESNNFKPKYPTMLSFTMTSFDGDFNNLNDNTSLVRLKNGMNCIIFEAGTYDGKTVSFNVPLNHKLWKHENMFTSVSDKEMKEMFIGAFTIEILGDWTREHEVIGLDNVKII